MQMPLQHALLSLEFTQLSALQNPLAKPLEGSFAAVKQN